jgi:predicted nuclease of restriction endonuclease-like (RecB) superfamily
MLSFYGKMKPILLYLFVMIKTKDITKTDDGYGRLLSGAIELLENARRAAARSVDFVMTATYWELGRRIVKTEQKGEARAGYGEKVLKRLSVDLTSRFGRGFSLTNLKQIRKFYLVWQIPEKGQTASDQLVPLPITRKSRTTSDLLISSRFALSWSQYVELLSVNTDEAREFYETEALRGGWTVRQLKRQIGSQFYERTLLSKNKAAMLTKGAKSRPDDILTAEEEVKNPYVLEFLGLKDEYSESDLEEALIHHLEAFLLELGGDFAFIGRQKRLRVGDEWYRVDLVFFHRRLRCLVLIDLKLDKFTHADAGQMNLYCNYARRHWTNEDENPPVGLILCAGKNIAVAEYALEGITNKILTSEYQTTLPDTKLLEAELRKTRKALERRKNSDL